MALAAREVEEETGWCPHPLEPLVTFQPLVGSVEQENLIYLARGADHVGDPVDVNEAERVAWLPMTFRDYLAASRPELHRIASAHPAHLQDPAVQADLDGVRFDVDAYDLAWQDFLTCGG